MGSHILVVDDNIGLLRLISTMLTNASYSVVEARSADDALAALDESTPDLIIADIMMPGMNGIELTEAIRSREDTAYVPVVIVSAHTDMDVVKQALEAGADHFLTKPIKYDALISTVQRVLSEIE